MISRVVLGITGFGGGFLAAGGMVAVIVGLGLITRFEGITHTAVHNRFYETALLAGALFGNAVTLFQMNVPAGRWGLLILGISSGIYTGAWILALAEVLHVFPIFARRFRLKKGIGIIVCAIALGKTLGSLLKFYMNW